LTQEARRGFARKGAGSLFDACYRNHLNHREPRDVNEPLGFPEDAIYSIAAHFQVVSLCEGTGIEEVAHCSAIAAGADDLVRKGAWHATEQFLSFFKGRDVIHFRNFGPALRHELVIDKVVKVAVRFDRDRDAFVLGESQRLHRVEGTVFVNCFDACDHALSLDHFFEEFHWV